MCDRLREPTSAPRCSLTFRARCLTDLLTGSNGRRLTGAGYTFALAVEVVRFVRGACQHVNMQIRRITIERSLNDRANACTEHRNRLRAQLLAVTFVVIFTGLVSAQPALAAGRCEDYFGRECLSPRSGEPGTVVEVDQATWKVVWNEDRPGAAGFRYRPDQPTIVVVEVDDNTFRDDLSFRVPDVPPGSYEVVIYDDTSYWWERFTVTGPGVASRLLLWVGMSVLGLVVAVLWVVRRRANSRSM